MRPNAKGKPTVSADFCTNLRSICAEFGSIAQVCREIGINRQQFNRYLNGTGMPSAHNLRRIARHFDLTEADFYAPQDEFQRRHVLGRQRLTEGPVDLMTGAFRGQVQLLRRYLGFYHAHFATPTWDGMVLRSLIRIYEQDGFVMTRALERVSTPDGSVTQRSRYEGLVTLRGNRLYVVEHEMVREGSVVETILTPSPRQRVRYLKGMTIGVAWRTHAVPYASRSIWKRIDERVSARDALRACGAFPLGSRDIDPTIRSLLKHGTTDSGDGTSAHLLT